MIGEINIALASPSTPARTGKTPCCLQVAARARSSARGSSRETNSPAATVASAWEDTNACRSASSRVLQAANKRLQLVAVILTFNADPASISAHTRNVPSIGEHPVQVSFAFGTAKFWWIG